ncbi:MAG TPA: hypothetical protein VF486_21650 [Actinomycetes bacterium]
MEWSSTTGMPVLLGDDGAIYAQPSPYQFTCTACADRPLAGTVRS